MIFTKVKVFALVKKRFKKQKAIRIVLIALKFSSLEARGLMIRVFGYSLQFVLIESLYRRTLYLDYEGRVYPA